MIIDYRTLIDPLDISAVVSTNQWSIDIRKAMSLDDLRGTIQRGDLCG